MGNLSGKKLLFIAGGEEQIVTIKWAAEQGVNVFVVDINENALGFQYAQATMSCDIKDKERILNFAKKHSIDGVTTICLESSMHTFAYLVEELGLTGENLETIENVTNKFNMRKIFKKAGLATPEFQFVMPELLRDSEFPGFDGPWVVKPVDSAGSRGVIFVDAQEKITTAYHNALAFSGIGKVMIEQYIPGKEISVEGFVINGELIVELLSDKHRSSLPYLFDTDIYYPSRYSPEIQKEAIRQTRIAIKALGIKNGPVHEELMVTPDENIFIVEIAGRGPGSKIYTEIIPHVSGIYPDRLQVMHSLGCLPAKIVRKSPLKGATIWWFGSQQRARIKKFVGIEKVKDVPDVFECRMYKKEGEIVNKCISGEGRIGQLITMSETLENAIEAQKIALETFRIELNVLN